MSKSASDTYTDKVALYDALVATNPNVKSQGDTIPNTSLNGHMFSYLGKTGALALRLPEGERGAFLTKYKTTLCQQYGLVQKEYVAVPDTLLARTQELKKYFAISYAYVASLKPKAKKKKIG